MNKYFKIAMQLLLIWSMEMTVVWIAIHYFFPIFPETIEESFSVEHKEISFTLDQSLSRII